MAFNFYWYGQAALGLVSTTAVRRFDWVGDNIRAHLCTSTEVPDQDADTFWSAAVANEVSWTNYSNGTLLGTKSTAYDTGTKTVRMIAADTVFTNVTGTGARILIVEVDDGVGDSTSPVIGYGNFGSDVAVTADDLTIDWDNTDGVLKMVVS